MKLKKATAVNQADLHSFMAHHEHFETPHNFNEKTSYVIENQGAIISWFQLELLDDDTAWLKKLFIVQNEALKLPIVLQTIIQYVSEYELNALYVHSQQLVTDLLLSSFSFNLQSVEQLRPFQREQGGKWWYYHLAKAL